MNRMGELITKVLEFLVVAIISVMSILVIVNVGLRFFFSSSIVVSEELSRFLFIYVVFLGAIIAMKEDAHIYVDFIAKSFPRPLQWIIRLCVEVAMFYCCYVLLLGSLDLTEFNMLDKSPVAGIPMGYIYFAGAVGGAGMGIVIIFRIIRHCLNFKDYFGPNAGTPVKDDPANTRTNTAAPTDTNTPADVAETKEH